MTNFTVSRNVTTAAVAVTHTPIQQRRKASQKKWTGKLNANEDAECVRKTRYTPPTSAKRMIHKSTTRIPMRVKQTVDADDASIVLDQGEDTKKALGGVASKGVELLKNVGKEQDVEADEYREDEGEKKTNSEREAEKIAKEEKVSSTISIRPMRRSRKQMENKRGDMYSLAYDGRISVQFADLKKRAKALEHIKRLVRYTLSPEKTISVRISANGAESLSSSLA